MSYSDVMNHRYMLFDSTRNSAYAAALEGVIGADTTVMDLGAGLGVHGFFAALLGAKKVYLIEPTAVIEMARMVAKDNGLHQVECLQTTAEELVLDARVDVITSVFAGNFLLTEDLLPSLFYARDHFLAPGGTLIPDRGCMVVAPVCATEYYQKHVQAWREYPAHCAQFGMPPINYSRVADCAANYLFYDNAKRFSAEYLAHPGTLMELDFNTATSANCNDGLEFTIEREGLCHGWLGWSKIRLGVEWLSTDGVESKTHWSQVFLPLAKPIYVKRGEVVGFHLKRAEGGEWTWDTTHKRQLQRQSTFLSQILKPADLLKKSELYHPALKAKGQAAQWLLGRMTGTVPIKTLVLELQSEFPDIFPDEKIARRFIHSLTDWLT